ncbi:hypothetical protein LR69_02560 [Geobacillus sp. BCO2]|nr:hypothetical protein LR69_02560 [Geobacillus sp. BCO2]
MRAGIGQNKRRGTACFCGRREEDGRSHLLYRWATSPQPIARIERLLSGLDGVERSLVDTEDGEVKVQFDEKKISKERIILTLQQHGFRFQ